MEKITLTLTPEEARRILRAVKARENHWSNPEMYNRYENAANIRKTYRDTANNLEQQMASQGVNP